MSSQDNMPPAGGYAVRGEPTIYTGVTPPPPPSGPPPAPPPPYVPPPPPPPPPYVPPFFPPFFPPGFFAPPFFPPGFFSPPAFLPSPQYSAVTSTVGGFYFSINNSDGIETYSATTTAGSVSISGTTVTVTGLDVNKSATVTVTDSELYYTGNSSQITGTSLNQSISAPTFSSPIAQTNGFQTSITNYDSTITYTVSVSYGTVSVFSPPSSPGEIIITGLSPGQAATVSVKAHKFGYADATGTQNGMANGPALIPNILTYAPGATTTSFNGTITNYDASYTWGYSATNGGTVSLGTLSGSTLPFTVSNLSPKSSSVITVTTQKSGYTSGSASATGYTKVNPPNLYIGSEQNGGFTIGLSVYDSTLSYDATAETAGTVTRSTTSTGYYSSVPQWTVTGLTGGQSSTVTITASDSNGNYQSNSAQITGIGGLTPAFGTNTPTNDGFTGSITNYNSSYTWSLTTDVGSVSSIQSNGSFTVTNAIPPTAINVTATVKSGSNQIGQANTTGYTNLPIPTFSAPVEKSGGGGFTVNITNYSSSYTYSISVDTGTLVKGTPSGSNYPLTVSGLTNNDTVTITVNVSENPYGNQTGSLTFSNGVKSIKTNVNGSWVSMTKMYINNNGSWTPAKAIYINNNGTWTQIK